MKAEPREVSGWSARPALRWWLPTLGVVLVVGAVFLLYGLPLIRENRRLRADLARHEAFRTRQVRFVADLFDRTIRIPAPKGVRLYVGARDPGETDVDETVLLRRLLDGRREAVEAFTIDFREDADFSSCLPRPDGGWAEGAMPPFANAVGGRVLGLFDTSAFAAAKGWTDEPDASARLNAHVAGYVIDRIRAQGPRCLGTGPDKDHRSVYGPGAVTLYALFEGGVVTVTAFTLPDEPYVQGVSYVFRFASNAEAVGGSDISLPDALEPPEVPPDRLPGEDAPDVAPDP